MRKPKLKIDRNASCMYDEIYIYDGRKVVSKHTRGAIIDALTNEQLVLISMKIISEKAGESQDTWVKLQRLSKVFKE